SRARRRAEGDSKRGSDAAAAFAALEKQGPHGGGFVRSAEAGTFKRGKNASLPRLKRPRCEGCESCDPPSASGRAGRRAPRGPLIEDPARRSHNRPVLEFSEASWFGWRGRSLGAIT